MKTLALVSLLTVLSATPIVNATEPDTVNIVGPRLTIEQPVPISRMWSQDYYDYKGSYSLSNGGTLSLFSRGRKMYANLEGEPAHEVVATASNTFVALDRKLKMTIDLLPNGEVRGQLLIVLPAERVASGDITGEKMLVVDLR